MRPQDLCWGFARTMRLSFFVGIAMIAGWWAHEQGKRAFARWDVRTILMASLAAVVAFSYLLARKHDAYTNAHFSDFIKIVVVALFTSGQVDTQQRLRFMYWTIALSLAFFGVKNGLLGIARGGATILRGPGGMLEDNNDFALALTMNVPLLWYLGIAEARNGRVWVQRATQVAVLLTVVTIALTHSRGGFLALTATSLWIAWRSGKLVRALGVLALLVGLFFLLAPQGVVDRLGSIGNTQESSIQARLRSWSVALKMIADNPVFGVGLRNFQVRYLEYEGVSPDADVSTHVAHNSYLQIWAENGSIAFAICLCALFATLYGCRWVFRVAKARPDLWWAGNYARMGEATTIAFMVGAFFLDRGHFDLIYHWVALVTCLVTITIAQLRTEPATAAAATAPAQRGRVTVRWAVGGLRAVGAAAASKMPGWR
jgi:probable O-glycosylation ligase (exosortase A-associated)